jgi:hypothetical protein
VQVEEIEKPPYEINDNTDDVMEPRPAAIAPASVRSSKIKRDGAVYNAYQDDDPLTNSMKRGSKKLDA